MVRCNLAPNCTGWPNNCPEGQPDADIAGVGVLISFVLAAALTLVASVAGHVFRPASDLAHLPSLDPTLYDLHLPYASIAPNDHSHSSEPLISDRKRQREARRRMWSDVLDRLVLSLSHQQLATCFAILLTSLIQSCTISIYHLNIICDLAWFATITHLLSISVLRHYWLQDSKQLALYVRSVLIVSALLMLLYILAILLAWGGGSGGCPAICVFLKPSFGIGDDNPLTIFEITVDACIVFWVYPTTALFVFPHWYRFYHFFMWRLPIRFLAYLGLSIPTTNGAQDSSVRFGRGVQFLAYTYRIIVFPSQRLAIICQVFLWCLRLFILIWDRLGGPYEVTDPQSELTWGFGQLLAVIIMFLPFLTLLETWSEFSRSAKAEIQSIGENRDDLSDKAIPLKIIPTVCVKMGGIQRRQSF